LVVAINLFIFPSKVNAMTQSERSKLRNCIVLYIGSSNSYVNTTKTKIDKDNNKVVPIIKNGRTLVPVRFISESLNAFVNWNGATSTVTISLKGNTAILNPGKHSMLLNNVKKELDVPAQIIESRTYLPLRRLVEDVLEKNIFYDRNVIIISGKDTVFDANLDKSIIDDLLYMYDKDNAIGHISGGNTHTATIKEDGTVWVWGNYGDRNISVPEMVYGLDRVIDISAGNKYTLALESDRTVWSWGNNIKEEGKYCEIPLKVENLSDVTRVSAAYDGQCMALKEDGSVWNWSYDYLCKSNNAESEKENVNAPSKVQGLSGIVDIISENNYFFALDREGIVWSWTQDGLPEKVSGISDVIDVSAGQSHVLALKKDGTVWIWKYSNQSLSYYGQLEGGDLTVPMQVRELSQIVAISARGGGHSVALKADGSVYLWGASWYKNGMNSLIPVRIKELDSVREIASGHGHILAFRNDGSLWAFGDNGNGQVGDGTFVTRNKPVSTLFNRNGLKVETVDASQQEKMVYEYNEQTTRVLNALTDNIMSKYGFDHYNRFIRRDAINLVEVNSVEDFLEAVKSNREIVLDPEGTYALEEELKDGEYGEYVEVDGSNIIIKNVENMIIRSKLYDGFQLKKPDLNYSLEFRDSKSIIIDGLNVINKTIDSKSVSSLFSFVNCKNVYINDTVLSGSKYGIKMSNVSGLAFDKSSIERCEVGIMNVLDSNNIVFKGSQFTNTNGSSDLINIMSSKNVLFTNCEISNNIVKTLGGDSKYQLFNLYFVEPILLVEDVVIKDNEADYMRVYENSVYFKNTTFENNKFSKGVYEVEKR